MELGISKPQNLVTSIPMETLTVFTLGKSIDYKDALDKEFNFR